MSAYSDWQCGAITEEQYRDTCNDEAARDEWYETHKEYIFAPYDKGLCDSCIHMRDVDGKEKCSMIPKFCEDRFGCSLWAARINYDDNERDI